MGAPEDHLNSLTSDKLEKEFIPQLLKPLKLVCAEILEKSGGDLEGNLKWWDADCTSADEAWWVGWFHFYSYGLYPSLPYYPWGKKRKSNNKPSTSTQRTFLYSTRGAEFSHSGVHIFIQYDSGCITVQT